MWSNTWPRPTPEERDITQVDQAVSSFIADIYATRNVVADFSSRIISAIIFDAELVDENNVTFYAYRYWIDGLDQVYPGLEPNSLFTGFSSTLLGTYTPLDPAEVSVIVEVEHLAAFLEDRFRHAPVAIRRYSVVPSEPGRADLIVES